MEKHIEQLNEKKVEKAKQQNNFFDSRKTRGQTDYVNAWRDW